MPTLHTLKVCGPCFTVEICESKSHFFISAPLWQAILQYEKMSRITVYVSALLWGNVWVINKRRGRVKGKSGVGISLLLSKSTKGDTRFNVHIQQINRYQKYIWGLLEKYSSFFFFFCKNLVDFNEAHLHEVTLILHTHAWIFSHLLIVSVDGKEHLSEVVFSALVGFSL